MPRSPHVFSKLSVSLVLAVSVAAGGVAQANPIPTSTDEARALAGQVTDQLHIDATGPANGAVTSTDQARAEAGRSLPAYSGAWVDRMLARNTDEGRAASVAGNQGVIEKERLAAAPAGAGMAAQGN
ncbi:MAG TPA: hypothetical protein VE034_09830 [Burkholderiales bacterium]|nr:hypothetical protein [Burkholderiales bacterium]